MPHPAVAVATVLKRGALDRLSPPERQYVTSLKRRAREDVVRLLRDDASAKRASAAADSPLRIRVLQSALAEPVRMSIFEELAVSRSEKYTQWVQRAVMLPLHTSTPLPHGHLPPRLALAESKRLMDEAVTGFEDAKTEVLKILSQTHARGCSIGCSIGLEGPPGIGKTHFVRTAFALATGRPLVDIPLGGAADVSYLMGQLYPYEGSREGRLAAGLIEAGCCDPIVFFDEVDKVSETERGRELIAALIHLTDPTSNTCLRDRWFHGIDLDFSRCIFVFSYNDPSRISSILLDRIRRMHIRLPTEPERGDIIARHIVPRTMRRINTRHYLHSDSIAWLAAQSAEEGGGMRNTERDVAHILTAVQLESMQTGPDDADAAGSSTSIPHPRVVKLLQARPSAEKRSPGDAIFSMYT